MYRLESCHRRGFHRLGRSPQAFGTRFLSSRLRAGARSFVFGIYVGSFGFFFNSFGLARCCTSCGTGSSDGPSEALAQTHLAPDFVQRSGKADDRVG